MMQTCKQCGKEFTYTEEVGYSSDICSAFCDGVFSQRSHVAALTAERDQWKKQAEEAQANEAVCHCGLTMSQHTASENHSAVEMEQPCPFAAERDRLAAEVVRLRENRAVLREDGERAVEMWKSASASAARWKGAAERLADAARLVASMAGKDWLGGQLMLASAIEEYEAMTTAPAPEALGGEDPSHGQTTPPGPVGGDVASEQSTELRRLVADGIRDFNKRLSEMHNLLQQHVTQSSVDAANRLVITASTQPADPLTEEERGDVEAYRRINCYAPLLRIIDRLTGK